MMSKKAMAVMLPIIVLGVMASLAFCNKQKQETFYKDSGFIFGTSYNIKYEYSEDIQDEIVKVLNDVDNSLSPFNEKSIITAVNQNKDVTVNEMFAEVFNLSKEINNETNGAFDITVAPLVNAWGFGFKNGKMPTDKQVDSLKALIGLHNVTLSNGKVTKKDARTMLDCSAIAKGYGVDKVAQLLDSKGIKNYMVEVGGELVLKGVNDRKEAWQIGVVKPTEDSLSMNTEMQTLLSISNIAMATSGNYRNFYYKGGKRYAHTIDPTTGYPAQKDILSATVFAKTCTQADAYATSFMVLGLDGTKKILSKHKELMAYIIYTDKDGEYAIWYSDGLKKHIE